jgi:hypothetical protein
MVVVGGALGLTSLAIHTEMVEEVNRRLPENQRFEDAWWGPTKSIRLFTEYRRLCPDGPLLRRQLMIFGVIFVLLAVAFACLSIP